MKAEFQIQLAVSEALKKLYNADLQPEAINVQVTEKEHTGDFTIVVFPFLRFSRKSPEITAGEIGSEIAKELKIIESYAVVKGYLNLSLGASYWLGLLSEIHRDQNFGIQKPGDNAPLVMVEYSSPNTNKPLHLGHIRNNLLGSSISKILEANGNKVVKTNIVNDRGIHICKSMYAWLKWGNGETPQSAGIKGDHLVGKYYVEFDKHFKSEKKELMDEGLSEAEAENKAPSMAGARELLLKWEAKDEEVVKVWKMMNSWVYEGFDVTYRKLGVEFDKIYYESETYLTGKEEVLRGVDLGVFEKNEDGSVWADLTKDGLDRKILLRSDGTSVYITQDIGTAKLRYSDYSIDKMVYVVGNEQNYHFQVLAILLDRLGFKWGSDLYHFSYGMVELPSGKMKSREGTVVDADDLIEEMVDVARKMSEELGKLDSLEKDEAERIYRIIALGALKYFILKVDPKKNMMFNPLESIDFNGNTGPFIQYTFARIQSVKRKSEEREMTISKLDTAIPISEKERGLVKRITQFPEVVKDAGKNYSPALIANYCYELTREYNQFYYDHSILNETNPQTRSFRLMASSVVGHILEKGMGLLGIEMPERM